MPTLCDFSVILDGDVTVEAPNVFTRTFNTGGRNGNSKALMIFNLRSLGDENVSVLVNNQNIGQLIRYRETNDRNWLSQTIVFDSDVLSGGNAPDANTIAITATEQSGDFRLKDIVCWFKQAA